jgi:tetratricopeptide (TPR) repeat protein
MKNRTGACRPVGWCSLSTVLAVAVLAAYASPALAQLTGRASAKEHYEIATRFYDIREYDKALDEYKAAYMAEPDPAFLYNIGQCHRKLGQSADALSFFQQFLKKTAPNDPTRKQAEARIRELEAEEMAKSSAAPEPATSTPETPAPPSAVASPPALPPAATPMVATAPLAAAPVDDRHPGRALRIAGIACGGLALASFATGIYYYTRATTLSDRVTHSPAPTAADDQAGRDAVTLQWVFHGVGAAALAAGGVLYWMGHARGARAQRSEAWVTPVLGPGLAGLAAQGAF